MGNFAVSQVTREWVVRYNGSANSFDLVSSMKIDRFSNVYIYGTTASLGSLTDILLNKYDPKGSLIWSNVIDGIGNSLDQVNGSFLDSNGNSYVTGITVDSNNVVKLITIKCTATGDISWIRKFLPNGFNQSGGNAVITDQDQNVFVAGSIRDFNGTYDIALLKYNSSGNFIDSSVYSGATYSNETPVSVCIDQTGNIYILGTSNKNNGFDDIIILKYDNSLNLVWEKTINGTASLNDMAVKMLIQNEGKLIVCGSINNSSSGPDYAVYKIDTNSAILSQYFYNGTGNSRDIPYDIVSDYKGNIYLTGSSRNADTLGSEDVLTIKLNSNCSFEWLNRFDGEGHGIDYGTSLDVDREGNVYAGGSTDKGFYHVEYVLLKYNYLGSMLWIQKYSKIDNSEDFIYTVKTDSSRNVFVSGISFDSTSDYDIATIKYSQPIGINEISVKIPQQFMLYQNYPNPFNPVTKIRFYLANRQEVNLEIYSIAGELVSKVLDNKTFNGGSYEIDFDASKLSTGVYFIKIISGGFSDTKKMVFLK